MSESTDKEDQEDELLALASIYDEEIFTATQEGVDPGGSFSALLDLPQPFEVKINNTRDSSSTAENSESSQTEEPSSVINQNKDFYQVQYLPPIILNFQLPANYPSERPPAFTLSCKWLTRQQLSKLCNRLDEIWEENAGTVILFSWFNFLKDESLDFLELSSPLDLSNILKRPQTLPKIGKNCDANGAIGETVIADSMCEMDPRAIQDIASQDLLLPTILENDKTYKLQNFNRTLYTCNVCFLEKLGELCLQFNECNHVFCKDCMKEYFEVQINDGSVKALTCPYDKCETQALPSQVKQLMKPEVFAKYDRLLLQCSLDTMADVIYCPRVVCQCPVLQDSDEYMGCCPQCNFVFCTLCKMAYHGVSPCRINSGELIKLRDAYLEANREEKKFLEKRYGMKAIKQALEETYSMEWLNEYSKKCPSCSTNIQKIDGCNKMTCTKCRTYFCWLCKSNLSRTNPYAHFSTLDSPCFNRLFEGLEMDEDQWEEIGDDW